MNAVSTLKIRSQEFLKLLENFQKKCQEKKLSDHDLHEFHQTITNSFQHSVKEKPSHISKESDAHLDQRVEESLKKLRLTLGSNKEILEKAAASVPYQEIVRTLEEVHVYVKNEEERNRRVSATEKGSMPESR